MPFTNPYMKTPDWGSGIQDIVSQLMQMMMINRMLPQNKTTEETVTEPQQLPMPRHGMSMMAQSPGRGQPPMQGAQAPPIPGVQQGGQIDPQMMMMLMQMMQGGMGR